MPDIQGEVPTEIVLGLIALLGTAVGALVWVIKNRKGGKNGNGSISETRIIRKDQRLDSIERTLDQISRDVRDIHQWCNKEDEDGIKLIYTRKGMQAAIDKLALSTESLAQIIREQNEAVHKLFERERQ